jgi:glutamate racemase
MSPDALRDAAPASPATTVRVGVFDSGVGGLSVLRALHQCLPSSTLHYVADSGHAPYGERDEQHVVTRSRRIAAHLVDHGAQALVVACNTATAAAVQTLRDEWPGLVIVGVEPGLKPALAMTRNGRVGVMATAGTLTSEKFQRLLASLAPRETVHLQACTGLAAAIERGDLDDPDLLALIDTHCRPLRDAHVDTVVLGCTHYPFVQPHIQAALGPDVQLVDTAWAVARHTAKQVGHLQRGSAGRDAPADVILESTGDALALEQIARRWLGFECRVGPAPAGL